MKCLDYYKSKVLAASGVSLQDFESQNRKREFVEARQAFFYIATKRTQATLEKIAMAANRTNHATVIHGRSQMEDLIKNYKQKFAWVEQILNESPPVTIDEKQEYKKAERLCLVAYESLRSGHLLKAYQSLVAACELLASPEVTDELLTMAADQKMFEEVNE